MSDNEKTEMTKIFAIVPNALNMREIIGKIGKEKSWETCFVPELVLLKFRSRCRGLSRLLCSRLKRTICTAARPIRSARNTAIKRNVFVAAACAILIQKLIFATTVRREQEIVE